MIRRIIFHGYLAEEYGAEIILDVASVGEICRAMQANSKTFYQKIRDGKFHIVHGDKWENGNGLSEKELTLKVGPGPIHIVPAISGSKSSGIFQIILGVAMIGAAVILGPAGGIGLGWISSGMELGLVMMGSLMILGGIAALLSPTPDQHNSYLFNGALNTMVQGGPVPVIYGTMMAGSTIVSSGLSNAQLLDNPADAAANGYWWNNPSSGNFMINLYTDPGGALPAGITVSPAPTTSGHYAGGVWIPDAWFVSEGGNLPVTVTAAAGDSIAHVYVDGTDVYDGRSNPFTYTFSNVQANHHFSLAGI